MADVLAHLHNGTPGSDTELLAVRPDDHIETPVALEFEKGCYVEVPAGSVVFVMYRKV